jgi:hypothetical protein
VPIDICVEIILTFRLEEHIKNYFVPMIFVITDFLEHSVLIKSGYLKTVIKDIRTMNYIECGINIIK